LIVGFGKIMNVSFGAQHLFVKVGSTGEVEIG
jgi:hypothetical protein